MHIDRPPDDLILKSLNWLRDEIFPTLVKHPLTDLDIAVWLCGVNGYLGQWEQTNSNDSPLIRHSNAQHRTYEAINTVVNKPQQGIHVNPLIGPLKVVNSSFTDNSGPRLPIMVHAGDLIGQGLNFGLNHIIPTLDLFANAGYHGIRSWTNVQPNAWWSDKPAPYWNILDNISRFEQILKEANNRGLKWHLVPGGLDGLSRERQRLLFSTLRDVLTRIGNDSCVLIEGCNEARDTTDNDDDDPNHLESLVNIVKQAHPNLLSALTAYTGTEDRETIRNYTPVNMPFTYIHGFRDNHVWDKIRHIFSWTYEDPIRPLAWQGEPFGPGKYVSVTANQHELDGPTMALAACMAAMCGQVWTFMSGPGVILNSESFESMPGFFESPAALRSLPQDLMTYQTRGHGGDRWANSRIHKARGNVRCDFSRHTDGRYCEIVYGPKEEITNSLEQVVNTSDVKRIINSPYGYVEIGKTL